MSRRIAIATLGTLGDIQPYVALAVALKARGYSVALGAPDDFAEMIAARGLEFHSLGDRIQEFLKQSQFEKAMSKNMLVNAPALLRQGQKIVTTAAQHCWRMAQGADALVLNMNTSFGIDMAEALDIPALMAALQPLNTTSEFPLCAYYGPSLGRAFNRATYTAMTVQQIYYNLPRNRLRRELMGLEPRPHGGLFQSSYGADLTTLYAYSEHVSPRPRDWPRSAIVTGYWMLPDISGWEPDAEFRAFLEGGDKPVYIGFGSMPFGAERNTEIFTQAMRLWGGRAVVARGWGGINPVDLPETVHVIDMAPHDKLFAHMAGVIHHGGAGTTAAGLALGRPTFVVPQAVDQPFWGRRVHELGCGPKPVRLRKLTPEILAGALEAVSSNPDYAANAAALGEKIRAEDGCARAIEVIERTMDRYQKKRAIAKVRRATPRRRKPLLQVRSR